MRATRFTPPGLRGKPERFANYRRAREVFLGESAVGLEDRGDGIPQVSPGFVERGALRIGPRKFLDKRDKPMGTSRYTAVNATVMGSLRSAVLGMYVPCDQEAGPTLRRGEGALKRSPAVSPGVIRALGTPYFETNRNCSGSSARMSAVAPHGSNCST